MKKFYPRVAFSGAWPWPRFVLMGWLLLALLAFKGKQEGAIRLELNNVPLHQALRQVEAQSKYTFVYNSTAVNVEQRVRISVVETQIERLLERLLANTGIGYRIVKQHIVLHTLPKEPAKPAGPIKVSGSVKDRNTDDILIGVNIVIKGTSTGTISDFDGNFVLEVPDADAVLVFSFMGYETQEEPLNGRSVLHVKLHPDVKAIEEVVVVGYGSSSKKLVTGSISSIQSKSLDELPVASLDGAMQGQATGVSVYQNSGTPGGGMSVRIRGNSSISAGSQPLYVVDGVPIITGDYSKVSFQGQGVNAIADLNPADIESISVLKDAAAAAIYGARASNGVVLITTKRGRAQQTRINFSSYYGVQQLYKKLEMLDATQYMEYMNDRQVQDGGRPIYSETQLQNPTVDTDWLAQVFRTAPIQNYELSAQGGSEKTRFYASGTLFDQQGILRGTSFQRLNGRVNVDHQINNWLTLGLSYGLSWSHNQRVEGDQSLNGPLPNALSLLPLNPVYNAAGGYDESGAFANPVAIANEAINWARSFRNLGNLSLEARLPAGFTWQSKLGIDYLHLNEHSYDPVLTRQGLKYNGLGIEANTSVMNITANTNLNYAATYAEKHQIDAMLGVAVESFELHDSYSEGVDFPSEKFKHLASAATIRASRASQLDRGLVSLLSRANYNFANKYLLTLNARMDGSSKFGANNRFGFFPSGSVAWRISEEDFFAAEWISELKLRASYGLTGNDQIPDFRSIGLYAGGANYLAQPGVRPVQLPNPDLRWETTAQLNLGLDWALWQNRLSFNFDVYQKNTTDLLLNRPVPSSVGYTSLTSNIGEMTNRGIELGINAQVLDGNLGWNIALNSSMNQNKVLKLYNNQPILDIGRGGNSVLEGHPVGSFYGYKSRGVDPSTGNIVFQDLNRDGEITTADRQVIGNPNPLLFGGLTNTLSWRGFTLSILLQYSYGNDVFNGSRIYLEAMKGNDNQTTAVLDRWRKPGDIATVPRATNSDPNKNNRISSRFVEDGSYLRLRNLNLSYDFDRERLKRWRLSSLRLYFTAQNLLTFTRYSGMDPEVNYAGDNSLALGTDFFTYPQARSFNLGINLGF